MIFATQYSDFRKVDGVLFPFHEESWVQGTHTASTDVRTVQWNPSAGVGRSTGAFSAAIFGQQGKLPSTRRGVPMRERNHGRSPLIRAMGVATVLSVLVTVPAPGDAQQFDRAAAAAVVLAMAGHLIGESQIVGVFQR